MKYIIDIPKNMVDSNGELLIQYKNAQDIAYNYHTGIQTTHYDESEAEKRGREEAWEFIKEIGKMSDDDMVVCFGTSIIVNLSYAEARAKYEAWKKKKDEIRIGDEIYDSRVKGIITYVDNSGADVFYEVVAQNGVTYVVSGEEAKKTGRTFPEVAELLEKMRESS